MDCNRLRGEIAAKYKTQSAFAEAMGWHKNKVSKLVGGSYKPDSDEVVQIAVALCLDEARFCAIFLPMASPNGDA